MTDAASGRSCPLAMDLPPMPEAESVIAEIARLSGVVAGLLPA